MARLKIPAALFVAALVCGCLTQPQIKERFVCSDGWVSDTAGDCAGRQPPCPKCAPKQACPECACSNISQQSAAAASAPQEADPCVLLGCPAGSKYVSSNSSGKYHDCGCRFAKTLSKKKMICYPSEAEAEAAGKEACGICIGSGA